MLRRDDEERRAEQRVGPRREDRRCRRRARRRGRGSRRPRERPIQLRWIAFVRSGHSPPGGRSNSSSSSAYAVVLKNHCVMFRSSTTAPQRSQCPSTTYSFAITVWSFGHQLTGASCRYARPCSKKLQEQPLRPAVEGGVVRRDLAVPVDRPAEPLHLRADRRDVPLGDLARVAALADRRVLGRQAERVPAHRAHDRPAVAAADVRRRRRPSCS